VNVPRHVMKVVKMSRPRSKCQCSGISLVARSSNCDVSFARDFFFTTLNKLKEAPVTISEIVVHVCRNRCYFMTPVSF